jgi:hypothetical protein
VYTNPLELLDFEARAARFLKQLWSHQLGWELRLVIDGGLASEKVRAAKRPPSDPEALENKAVSRMR